MTPDATTQDRAASFGSTRILALILVALPILMNAVALYPEVHYGAPSDNDQIFHYLFIERANQAIAAGDNPVDHWLPELELGFAQFHYYQNLPHLTVVALHHLMLERVSLLTVLNVVRYLLMVLFPLTVYWSMRQMEFSIIAAAVGAAFSSTLSSAIDLGFDYHSYIWGGFGLFPQLCSMHLIFVGVACLRSVLERGRRFGAAIISASAIVLSDLIYGYIFAIAAVVLLLLSVLKALAAGRDMEDRLRRISRAGARFAIVAATAAAITAYQVVPFLTQIQYLNKDYPAYPRHLTPPSLIMSAFVANFFGGAGFDYNRLPALEILLLLGILYGAITRSKEAKLALAFLGAFVFLMLAPVVIGPLLYLIPLWRLLPVQRLVAGRDFAAILLVGLGGELIWKWWPSNTSRVRAVIASAALLAILTVALADRWGAYQNSANGMATTADALADDSDLPLIISAIKKGTPGRVYAGTRGNWGSWMAIGTIRLYDLLPIEQFDTVMPWQTLSLNALYLWSLDIPDLKRCRLFNIRYIIAPLNLRVPPYYQPLLTTPRYVLYQIDSGGYMQLGQIARVLPLDANLRLIHSNLDWIAGKESAQGRFIAFRSRSDKYGDELIAAPDSGVTDEAAPQPGSIEHEVVTPDSMSADVTANTSALLVIKVSYHPNWHVLVDGKEQHSFMVSPSYIGTMLGQGQHRVRAEYRSSRLKKLLMVLAGLTLAATLATSALGLKRNALHYGSVDP